jgi:hypothetical protein
VQTHFKTNAPGQRRIKEIARAIRYLFAIQHVGLCQPRVAERQRRFSDFSTMVRTFVRARCRSTR